jgi:uncharacterized membrane protein YhaH (DUF805 family)
VAAPPVLQVRPSLIHVYFQGWERSATFRGRADRRECFTFLIGNAIIALGLLTLNLFGIAMFFLLGVQLPQLAVSVRRLHDTGKSGWWMLVGLVPIGGWVLILALLLKDGDLAENEYGRP